MLIALTRWQTKRMSLLAKLLSNHYNREARGAMYDGWVIYKAVGAAVTGFARAWRTQTASAVAQAGR